ncbi:MAG TPA: DUF433 domain-containing protein [Pyrinomonadaceae bacterium]|jgi:uncharacterized protein (DUF433 family)
MSAELKYKRTQDDIPVIEEKPVYRITRPDRADHAKLQAYIRSLQEHGRQLGEIAISLQEERERAKEADRDIHPEVRELAENLCDKHPSVVTNERVLGGAPHIRGTRLSVARILTCLYHLESIDAVVGDLGQRISREQVKEAIAYAHDFLEMACDPPETND